MSILTPYWVVVSHKENKIYGYPSFNRAEIDKRFERLKQRLTWVTDLRIEECVHRSDEKLSNVDHDFNNY